MNLTINYLIKLLLLLTINLLIKISTASAIKSDSCDWEGSGVGDNVIPIALRCLHGTIKWHYPNGGLLVHFEPSAINGDGQKYFRGYFTVNYKTNANVIIYIIGLKKKLIQIYSKDMKPFNSEFIRTFLITDKRAVLYLDAKMIENILPLVNDHIEFNYHLKPFDNLDDLLNEESDCRPCTEKEIVRAYCESDLIFEGTVSSLTSNQLLQRNELNVKVSHIVKMFKNFNHNKVNNNNNNYFNIYHPLKCNANAGTDTKFMFIGQWLLDQPTIRCAPKLSQWKLIKHKVQNKQLNVNLNCIISNADN